MTSIWLSADLSLFPSHEILSYPKTFRHMRFCLTPRPSVTRGSVLPQDLQSHEILSYPKTFSHTRFCLTPRPPVTRDSVLPQDLQSHEILSYPKTFSHTRFCLTPRPFCLGEENGVSLWTSDHLTLFSVFTSPVLLTRLKAAHRLCNEEINNNNNNNNNKTYKQKVSVSFFNCLTCVKRYT